MSEETGILVSPTWLHERLGQPDLVVVEASFYLPDEGKDADAIFREGHIPGAVRFDVDAIADRSSGLPHMLPDAQTFSSMVGALGIGDDMTVVIYDDTDHLGGARAWWMLDRYGARNVKVLEGGYKAWTAQGFATETGASERPPAQFAARFDGADVVAADEVLAASTQKSAQIVDARAKGRFEGAVAEPRPGLRSGHIPSSKNVPWRSVLDADGRFLPLGAVNAVFADAGLDVGRPLIASCGSGVSAAVLILGLEQTGKANTTLYDGSWSEWGGRHDLPIETGPAQP